MFCTKDMFAYLDICIFHAVAYADETRVFANWI